MGLFDFLKKPQQSVYKISEDQRLLEPVEIMPDLILPRLFANHWAAIEQTRISFISISATPAKDLDIRQSSFGHYPCLPKDYPYPTDQEGVFLFPLAQINFSSIPILPGYPTSGYLQFYIQSHDDLYGLDFDHPAKQKNFRVLYFTEEELKDIQTDFSFLDGIINDEMAPVHTAHTLHFTAKDEFIGVNDVRSHQENRINLLSIIAQHPAIETPLENGMYEHFDAGGHKIGGYADFTQADPRLYNKEIEEYILLFQMDTDDHIMWGDAGIANFFIHPDDLAKMDFSKVLYNWDCS